MPLPAVSHCTSPLPKRAVAPSESEWSMKPRRTSVTVSKPRCGCCGNPGTVAPWYMLQPSPPEKSWPMSRPSSGASGPSRPLPRGYASSWCTQNRNGSTVGQRAAQLDRLQDGIGHVENDIGAAAAAQSRRVGCGTDSMPGVADRDAEPGAVEPELGRRGVRQRAHDTVVREPGRAAEHEEIATAQLDVGPRPGAGLVVAEAEDAGVTEADRDHRAGPPRSIRRPRRCPDAGRASSSRRRR